MSNQKYSQVTDLLDAGSLNWATDDIKGCLMYGASFVAGHQRLSQVGTAVSIAPIHKRYVGEDGSLLGFPAFFPSVSGGAIYQMVVVQDIGNGDPRVLAWYDTDVLSQPLSVLYTSTLIVRPAASLIPDGAPIAPRVWMSFP